uniref:Uncharacterized protein n=1 Tax=Arundo donax TaxID=35708 RepID=A0A0A9GHG9_ARUDO
MVQQSWCFASSAIVAALKQLPGKHRMPSRSGSQCCEMSMGE